MKIYIIALFVLVTTAISAQSKTIDVIKLINGHSVRGEILHYDIDGEVTIRLASGRETRIPTEVIRSIDHRGLQKSIKPYAFKEQGFYNATTASVSFNTEGAYSLVHVMGHRFNRLIGVGLGAGLENFEDGEGKRFIPIFAEIRGFLFDKKISPYYNVKLGYGKGLKNEDLRIARASGGIHFSPEIGYRLGGGDAVNFFLGLSMKFQNGSFTYEFPWDETVVVEDLKYRRYMVNVGILF